MKTVMSIRFPVDQHLSILTAAHRHANGNPAELVRRAVSEHLERLDGGGLESRLSALLEAMAATLPTAIVDEIERRVERHSQTQNQEKITKCVQTATLLLHNLQELVKANNFLLTETTLQSKDQALAEGVLCQTNELDDSHTEEDDLLDFYEELLGPSDAA